MRSLGRWCTAGKARKSCDKYLANTSNFCGVGCSTPHRASNLWALKCGAPSLHLMYEPSLAPARFATPRPPNPCECLAPDVQKRQTQATGIEQNAARMSPSGLCMRVAPCHHYLLLAMTTFSTRAPAATTECMSPSPLAMRVARCCPTTCVSVTR